VKRDDLTLLLDLHHEIIVDNFAGGGGASHGIEMATGRRVDIAINHDPEAIALHSANHPETRHYCESVWDIDPREVTQGRPVALGWFSPDCKHFSKAKGGKPRDKKIRGLAWVAVRWAATVRPRVIMLENVEEFLTWGPLTEDGQPCPKNKGRTFRGFTNALRSLGYKVEWREMRACDYGTPTIRKRLFLIARCDGRPIAWPEATHGATDSQAVKAKLRKPWRTAAECIDWAIPCPSIFERSRPLAEATLRRIARGIQRYVIDSAKPYIVTMAHGEGQPGKTQRWGAGAARHAIAAATLIKHYGGNYTGPGVRMDEPMHTTTTTDRHALVSQNSIDQDITEPFHTVMAGATRVAVVRAFLVKYYGNEKDGVPLSDPMHTIPCTDRMGLVTVSGIDYQIADIGMRMLEPRELYRAQGFPDSYKIDIEINGRKLPKHAQVRMAGNSVCPQMAAALVRANLPELVIHTSKERMAA
jgi:DNA (cytosine-5)-methyltransferase 1